MSNKVSVLVYSRRAGSPVRKAILVYFAERASDNGEGVWASKATIAGAVECGRSTVIRTINEFVEEGLISPVGTRRHKNGETVEYRMNLGAIAALPKVKEDQSHADTSPASEPVPERDQSQSGTLPVPERDSYPSRSGTQTTIRTINEPPKSARVREVLCEEVSEEAADSFMAFRKRHKSKGLSETGARRLVTHLAEIRRRGGNPDDALGLAEERGWASVEPDWYFRNAAPPGSAPADDSARRIERWKRMAARNEAIAGGAR